MPRPKLYWAQKHYFCNIASNSTTQLHCSTNLNARNKRRGYSLCYKQGGQENTLKGIELLIEDFKPLNYGGTHVKTRDDLGHLASYNWLVSWMALFGATAEKSWFKKSSTLTSTNVRWSTQELHFWVRAAALSEKKGKKRRGGGTGSRETIFLCAGCVRIGQPIYKAAMSTKKTLMLGVNACKYNTCFTFHPLNIL